MPCSVTGEGLADVAVIVASEAAAAAGRANPKSSSFAPDFVSWVSRFWTVRSSGGCLDAMMVASGCAEAWIEPVALPWDLAPLKIIAEEAGCVTFDFAGNDTIYGGNFVITAPAFADELREFVSRK